MKAAIDQIAAKMVTGKNVAFTGAGISTESGIPDYRSQGGIWDEFKPVYFDDFMSEKNARPSLLLPLLLLPKRTPNLNVSTKRLTNANSAISSLLPPSRRSKVLTKLSSGRELDHLLLPDKVRNAKLPLLPSTCPVWKLPTVPLLPSLLELSWLLPLLSFSDRVTSSNTIFTVNNVLIISSSF